MKDKIKFCGHEIDKNGLYKTSEKITVIQNAKVPAAYIIRKNQGVQ